MPDPGYPNIGDLPPEILAALNGGVTNVDNASAMVPVANAGQQMIPQGSGISIGKAAALALTAITVLPDELVAAALAAISQLTGWGTGDIVTEALQKKGKGRRRRGITYRQLSTARRVNRTIVTMYNRLRDDFPAQRHHHAAPAKKRK